MNLCLPAESEFLLVHKHGDREFPVIALLTVLKGLGIEYEAGHAATHREEYKIAIVSANRGVVTLRINDFVVVSKAEKKAWVFTYREYADLFLHNVEFFSRCYGENGRLRWRRVSRAAHLKSSYLLSPPKAGAMSPQARAFRKEMGKKLLTEQKTFRQRWLERQQKFHEEEKARRRASGEKCRMLVGRRKKAKPCVLDGGHDGPCKAGSA